MRDPFKAFIDLERAECVERVFLHFSGQVRVPKIAPPARENVRHGLITDIAEF
jgi:hypothetical protein